MKDSDLDKYYESLDKNQLNELSRVKKIAKKVVPQATERLSYGIPTLDYRGKHLLHFAAFKNHYSLFPGPSTIALLINKLDGYKLAKGTIQYTDEKPISAELIKEIVNISRDKIDK